MKIRTQKQNLPRVSFTYLGVEVTPIRKGAMRWSAYTYKNGVVMADSRVGIKALIRQAQLCSQRI
jgi:hypothetical protein